MILTKDPLFIPGKNILPTQKLTNLYVATINDDSC
jgi:hypothetical protein